LITETLYSSTLSLESMSFQLPEDHELNLQRISTLIYNSDQTVLNLKSLEFYVPDSLEQLESGIHGHKKVVIQNTLPPQKARRTDCTQRERSSL